MSALPADPSPRPGTVSEAFIDAVYPRIARSYARQSRLIDTGDARGWADTFTSDGVFQSPSYPEPIQGRTQLEAFARRYTEQGIATCVVSRHVISNVDITPGADSNKLVGHTYLQIVATPAGQDSRLIRLTTTVDQLVQTTPGRWLIAHRQVFRDDAGLPEHPD